MIGEFYGNYYYLQHKLPFVRQDFKMYMDQEMLGAGRWRGTLSVWRNVTPTLFGGH